MHNGNRLKIGSFGANCSSGRFATTIPERWSASWDDNVQVAKMLDDAGLDFLLPNGRWKGYGGETDFQGTSFETISWAVGLLASTKRINVFCTVHAPLFSPVIAAKQMVTADHVGHGRFGVNVVCGWNEDEFDMFGVTPGDHAARYRQGQEWVDVLKLIWERDDFDFKGEFFNMKGVRAKPKPYGDTLPLLMNAGASKDGRAFALRNCDAWFTTARQAGHQWLRADISEAASLVKQTKAEALALGREIEVYTVGQVICRPTRKEAEDYHHFIAIENADWAAIDKMLDGKGLLDRSPEEVAFYRNEFAKGKTGMPLFGSPDDIAGALGRVSAAGFRGIAISLVNELDEFPYFIQEVLPRLERLGLRTPLSAAVTS